ncbi:MAG: DUF6364 family protein [Bythopirellula sp.]|nr:DUF6364 family protein [Bythopirellula sp.]
MQTKLTLRLEEKLIQHAKRYAAATGKSLSQVVGEYFTLLQTTSSSSEKMTPTVKKLRGSLNKSEVSEEGYHEYLSGKYR